MDEKAVEKREKEDDILVNTIVENTIDRVLDNLKSHDVIEEEICSSGWDTCSEATPKQAHSVDDLMHANVSIQDKWANQGLHYIYQSEKASPTAMSMLATDVENSSKNKNEVPSLKEIAGKAKDKLVKSERSAGQRFAPMIRLRTPDSELSLDDSSCSIEVLYSDSDEPVLPEACPPSLEQSSDEVEEGESPVATAAYRQGYEEGYEAGSRQHLWLLNRTVDERDNLVDLFKDSHRKWIEENELLLLEVQEVKHAYNKLIQEFTNENPRLPEHAYRTLFSNTFTNDRALATCVQLQHNINEQTLRLYGSEKEKLRLQRQVTEMEQILASSQVEDNGRGDSLCRHSGEGHDISGPTVSDVIVMDDHKDDTNKAGFISDPQLSIITNFEIGSGSVLVHHCSSGSSADNSP